MLASRRRCKGCRWPNVQCREVPATDGRQRDSDDAVEDDGRGSPSGHRNWDASSALGACNGLPVSASREGAALQTRLGVSGPKEGGLCERLLLAPS